MGENSPIFHALTLLKETRDMPKQKMKTHKTAAKRFGLSGKGRLMCLNAANSHMFLHKTGSRKRRLEIEKEVDKGNRWRMKRLLGI
jgi:large subunit ribosomal protein L35